MRPIALYLLAAAAMGLSAMSTEAMPVGVTSSADAGLRVVQVAGGCGPGLVRGRLSAPARDLLAGADTTQRLRQADRRGPSHPLLT